MNVYSLITLVVVGLLALAGAVLLYPVIVLLRGMIWCGRSFRRLLQRHSEPVADPAAPDCTSTAPLVVAIHGTFAPRAPWAQPDSPFHAAVAEHVGAQAGLNWHALNWSGANTVSARLETIGRLNELLESIFTAQPLRRVCLIGHSHGGNIALRSAQAFADRPGLRLVTLATPFLIAQPRPAAALFALVFPLLDMLGSVDI